MGYLSAIQHQVWPIGPPQTRIRNGQWHGQSFDVGREFLHVQVRIEQHLDV
jgi:hypothetical protein